MSLLEVTDTAVHGMVKMKSNLTLIETNWL